MVPVHAVVQLFCLGGDSVPRLLLTPCLPSRVCLAGPQFDFSEDPLRASLDYLHHAARQAGRPPHYSGAVQAAVSAEERLYKERLARAHFARWGGRLVAGADEVGVGVALLVCGCGGT